MPSRASSSMAPPLLQRHHELQGPRPEPLKVNGVGTTTTGTDLLGVNKRRRLHQQAPPLPRQPVIIYVESPRVVHAHPGEFKSVVQRLTGAPAPVPPMMVFPGSSSAPPPPVPLQLQFPFQFPLVGAAGSAGALLPLTSTVMSVTLADTTGGAGGGSPVHHQLANHHLLVRSDDPFLSLPPSLSSCYQHHGGDLFVDHHH